MQDARKGFLLFLRRTLPFPTPLSIIYSLVHLCCHYEALCDCSLANRPMNLDSSPFAAVDDTEINQVSLIRTRKRVPSGAIQVPLRHIIEPNEMQKQRLMIYIDQLKNGGTQDTVI